MEFRPEKRPMARNGSFANLFEDDDGRRSFWEDKLKFKIFVE
jgi:hypothetical protein